MDYKEHAAKGGAWSTGLEGRVGMNVRTWVINVAFATHAILGARRHERGSSVRELGREARMGIINHAFMQRFKR